MVANYQLNIFAEIAVSILVLSAGFLTLVGAIGIVKFKDIFERVHLPAILCTLANWCLVLASVLFFSSTVGHVMLNAFLIAILLALTNPISTIFLMRTSLFRRRNNGEFAPKNSSRLQNEDKLNK